MPKIGPQGAPQRGGQKFFEHFSLNTVMVHLCKFREDSAQETRVFSQIIAKEEKEKEKKEKEKKEKKNSSGFETLLRRVKIDSGLNLAKLSNFHGDTFNPFLFTRK